MRLQIAALPHQASTRTEGRRVWPASRKGVIGGTSRAWVEWTPESDVGRSDPAFTRSAEPRLLIVGGGERIGHAGQINVSYR